MKKRKIAIIGAGVGGLTAGYLLHPQYDITVYEKSNRMGGNAYMIETPEGQQLDIAVAAFGMAGYGEFYALLDELQIKTHPSANTYMSFHNLESGEGLYLTPTFKAGLKQGFELIKPKTLKILYNLYMGLNEAQQLHLNGKLTGLTMRDMLGQVKKLSGESQRILLCALCLLSSMSTDDILQTPADFFMYKLRVHDDVISPRSLYSVRTVEGGTQAYIKALAKKFKSKIRFNAKIRKVLRDEAGVTLLFEDGERHMFEQVVLACNADQALKLLDDPTPQEKRLLGVWSYNEGRVVVHKDHASFPPRELIQAYTFLYTEKRGRLNTSVNGALWFEPQVKGLCDYISSQYPNFPIREELVIFDKVLRTPKFSFETIKIMDQMQNLNGVRRTSYCGSYFGFGLHNDAVKSAIAVARGLGIERLPVPTVSTAKGLVGLVQGFLK